ncbi:MAG: serine/threonine-protein kinase [Lachnospiraceae bacterium]|nr:serine/threonine-protein kinase [Lachnospiraceae bacterium]
MSEVKQVGKYRFVKPLGQGGEGSVYLAEDEGLGRYVAVKRLWEREDSEKGREERQRGESERGEREWESGERIRAEAAFLRDLRHPMLPVVYELLYEDGWYLVMEYVEGISLHNYIEKQGSVEEGQARLWAAALLDVLDYLHTRETPVIYRDLKPDNIMVCRDGSLKLVDFGAAGLRSFVPESGARMAFSAGFAAPEQRGEDGLGARADERSDLYAFGKTLYYMVTGAVPRDTPDTSFPASYYNPLLSEELEEIIECCTRKEPEARYQVAGEVMRDLAQNAPQGKGGRGREFVRHIEKQICLTDFYRL